MKHIRTLRTAGWLVTAGLLGAAVLAPATTLATPTSAHQVAICHATGSDANPYHAATVDISSSGHLQGGHDTSHTGPIWNPTLKDGHIAWGDIIPPYSLGTFTYAGQNWSDAGQALWAVDCEVATPQEAPSTPPSDAPSTPPSDAPSTPPSEAPSTPPSEAPSTPPSEAPSTTPSEAPSTPPSEAPSGTPATEVASQPAPVATPDGAVLGETGRPETTLPPTDTLVDAQVPTSSSWQLFLLALAGILSGMLVLVPTTARRR